MYSHRNSKKIVRVCTSVPSSPCLRPWVLVWPRAQTHDIPSTLQSNTLRTSALSNPYLWGTHLNLICVSRTLKWSSLNKILILNYFYHSCEMLIPQTPQNNTCILKWLQKYQYLWLEITTCKQAHLCFLLMFLIIKFEVWMFVSHIVGFCRD